MKSAYELAMERLDRSEPKGRALTAEQKKRIGEIDLVYKGRQAEREIFLKSQIETSLSAGDPDAVDQLRRQLASEKIRLEEECEEEKERVRRG
ncbi:MAG: hypothetical protein ABII82_15855 [Verrucomicrobiota bacterium]